MRVIIILISSFIQILSTDQKVGKSCKKCFLISFINNVILVFFVMVMKKFLPSFLIFVFTKPIVRT
jgi:hypothetical protein